MNRTMRFSSAAMGMVLLAGLAYYQGDVDPTLGQEGALVGTVLPEPVDMEVTADLAMDEVHASDCENTAGLEGTGTDKCTEQEKSTGTN